MRSRVKPARCAAVALACVLACWPAVQATGATGSSDPTAGLRVAASGARARPLLLTQSGVVTRLPSFRLDGRRHTYTVTIRKLQVMDERSSSSGWRLIAALAPFRGAGRAEFSAAVTVIPDCSWAGGSQVPRLLAGPTRSLTRHAVALCAAAADREAGSDPADRVFDISVTLTVTIPAYVPAGRYSATLTFTLLGRSTVATIG
jgi:hypothetical protein